MNLKIFSFWGVHYTTFYPELRNEFKNFSNPGGSIPQLLTLNSEMNLKIFPILGGVVHSTAFDPELRNESFALIFLWGFLQY